MSKLDEAVNKRDKATEKIRSKMSELDAAIIKRDMAQKELEKIIYKRPNIMITCASNVGTHFVA